MKVLVKLTLIIFISSFAYGCNSDEEIIEDKTLAIANKLNEMLPESIQLNSINSTDIEGLSLIHI